MDKLVTVPIFPVTCLEPTLSPYTIQLVTFLVVTSKHCCDIHKQVITLTFPKPAADFHRSWVAELLESRATDFLTCYNKATGAHDIFHLSGKNVDPLGIDKPVQEQICLAEKKSSGSLEQWGALKLSLGLGIHSQFGPWLALSPGTGVSPLKGLVSYSTKCGAWTWLVGPKGLKAQGGRGWSVCF